MNLLLFSIFPIIIIIAITIASIYFSDSNKYKKKLSNNEQIKLEQLREEVIKRIKDIKSTNKNELNDENIKLQKDLISTIKKQSKEIQGLTDSLRNYKDDMNLKHRKQIIKDKNINLVFNQKNIIRGLITTEYIERKNRR